MKKTFLSIATVALAMSMNSCSNDNEPVSNPSRQITVSTEISKMARLATATDGSQTFTDGDQISVYAWTGSATTAPEATDLVVNNVVNTLSSGKWAATEQMLWKNTTDSHYFLGVYPKTDGSITNLTASDYTINFREQEKSDLLVATNTTGLKATSNPVLLTFDHVMAKLKINLTFRNQWGGTPTVESVHIKNAANMAKVNYLTKTVTASTNRGKFIIPEVEANTAYASIVVPQTGVKSIVIRIGDKDYTYTHSSDFVLESGKITTVNLIVGRDEITLGTVSINDWQEGNTINGGEADC